MDSLTPGPHSDPELTPDLKLFERVMAMDRLTFQTDILENNRPTNDELYRNPLNDFISLLILSENNPELLARFVTSDLYEPFMAHGQRLRVSRVTYTAYWYAICLAWKMKASLQVN